MMFNVSVSAALTLNDKLRGELLLLATRLCSKPSAHTLHQSQIHRLASLLTLNHLICGRSGLIKNKRL